MTPPCLWALVGLMILTGLTTIFAQEENWFQAGTYVVTQEGLNEAPYRYAKFLDEGLRKIEQEDFPLLSNGDPCGFRYRIGPTVEKSKLRLDRNSIKVTIADKHA